MQYIDYYSEPASYEPRGMHLSTEDVAKLIKLMRELRELTQSRTTYAAASEFLAQMTGERDTQSLINPEILAQ
ncbi:MAG: hypothetical protein ACKVP7_24000 [Hyphomicrobiaceae bacterium]